MDPISNVDHLVLLLRQRLAERSRAGSLGQGGQKRPADLATPQVDGLHALAAIDGVDDRQLRRALIQNILAEQLGSDLINDAKFQQVVDRVTETIEGESGAAKLLSRVVVELRASAR